MSELYYIRYLDDIDDWFEHAESASRFEWMLHQRLEYFGFSLVLSKTRLVLYGPEEGVSPNAIILVQGAKFAMSAGPYNLGDIQQGDQ